MKCVRSFVTALLLAISLGCSSVPAIPLKYPRPENPNPPPNYGFLQITGADGKTHIEATEDTIAYIIELHYLQQRIQALPIWED